METSESSYLRSAGSWLDICIKVTPKSKREGVGRVLPSGHGDRLEVRVNAPPLEGKANQAVEQLLAKTLKIPSSHCQVHQGHSSRYKSVRIPYTEGVYNMLVALWPIHSPQQTELFSKSK